MVPTADNPVRFTLTGPGKIIGVGNGDPTSHEPDRFFESVKAIKIEDLKELAVDHPVTGRKSLPGSMIRPGNLHLSAAGTTIGVCIRTPFWL